MPDDAPSRALRFLVPALAFCLALGVLLLEGNWRGGYRIDEAQKVADTFFLRLLMHGDFSNPAWFRHIVDRTNPPLGKFLFGAGAALAGAPIPASLAIRVELPDGSLGQTLQPPFNRTYRRTLIACRLVSIIATALTAAMLAAFALRLGGLAAAITATLLYAPHYLTIAVGTAAVYDALLTMFVFASLAPLVALVRTHSLTGRTAAAIVLAGLCCACAFEVRASGLIAFGAMAIVLLAFAIARRSVRPLMALGLILAILSILSVVMDPYVWADDGNGTNLLMRIPARMAMRIHDLRTITASTAAMQPMLGLAGKLRFGMEVVLSDWCGVLAVLGIAILATLMTFRRETGAARIAALIWSAAIIGGIVLWLPFAWPRYLLVTLPPLALAGGLGWATLLRRVKSEVTSD